MTSELPPNERPVEDEPNTLLWAVVGVIVIIGIISGSVVGFMGGRIFNAVRTVTDAEVMRLLGALPAEEDGFILLTDVRANGPADVGGLAENDVLLRIDDTTITSAEQAKRVIAGYAIGDVVLITFERGFRPLQTEVTIGVRGIAERPTATPRPQPTVITPPAIPPGQQRENAQLGIIYRSIGEQDGDRYGVTAGAIVLSVTLNGPADFGGMEIGDIIIGVGNISLSQDTTLFAALNEFTAGQQLKITVLRDGEEEALDVVLGR